MKLKLKLNVPLLGKRAGETLVLETDQDGVILHPFWRSRLADSAIDKCVEVVSDAPEKTNKKGDK